MSKDLTKKAIEMLLKGATLLGEPCPYCKGVRVMKDGHALCVNCGKEPEKGTKTELDSEAKTKQKQTTPATALDVLKQKLHSLSIDLEKEKDHEKQQKILKSINSLIETIEKLKKQQ